MKYRVLFLFITFSSLSFAQANNFKKIEFLIGNWEGTGKGFGNDTSKIVSNFDFAIGNKYVEIKNESWFAPTKENPEGEHHIDRGFISFDENRKLLVYRQFNIEGFVNQYFLNDSFSNDSTLTFDSEQIENFVPGGKARWTIKIHSQNEIETLFHVSFPNEDYTCFGSNYLRKIK